MLEKIKYKWLDTSSFDRGSTDRTPNSFALLGDRVRISVHRHIHYPGKWLVTCHRLGIDGQPLNAVASDDAKMEAMQLVNDELNRLTDELDKMGKVKIGKTVKAT